MRIFKIALLSIALSIFGCASNPTSSTLSISPEVRASSKADDRLFKDMAESTGGVGYIDKVLHRSAKSRVLIKIEVISPYNGKDEGLERWHIQHDGKSTATYLVELIPDGNGGTFFATSPEN